MKNKLICLISIFTFILITYSFYQTKKKSTLPIVAIASYGPHASLDATLSGFKQEMQARGFVENKTIHYEYAHVGFTQNLIDAMLSALRSKHPKVMLVMTTPVAQTAKGKIKDIPLVYAAITDPVEAGLIKERYTSEGNLTGSSDMQDLDALLRFAHLLLPKAKKIGVLYSTAEANDAALINMMKASASKQGMSVVAVPVDQARDVQIRMQEFKDKVDFIYVGTSGPIQPTLPVIAAEARKMKIPVFNVEAQAVKEGLALASFGVDYTAVGRNAATLAAKVLCGENVTHLEPVYPKASEHHGVINQKIAKELGIAIPADLPSHIKSVD